MPLNFQTGLAAALATMAKDDPDRAVVKGIAKRLRSELKAQGVLGHGHEINPQRRDESVPPPGNADGQDGEGR